MNGWAAVVARAVDQLDPPQHPYASDPVGFARDVLGFTAWSKQREIMESVRDHQRTAVRSCHGIGKSTTAAQIALWFLATHGPSCRVITTAPTWVQVKGHLWRPIREAVSTAHAHGRLAELPAPNQTDLEVGDQWFAVGSSTDQPERFQGHHADHLLLIVDEASGIDERIYEAAEGFLTAEGARVLLIGNPTKIGGQFYRAFTAERARWSTIAVSVYDSPNYTGEGATLPADVTRSLPRADWAAEVKLAWGEDSPIFQVRALGQFSTSTDVNVISLGSVEEAQTRELAVTWPTAQGRAVVACDVARFGGDETAIATRHDRRIELRETYTGRDLMQTVGSIVNWWRVLRDESGADPVIVVDDDGVGGGVTDRLRELGHEVVAFNGGARALQPDHYPNRRSEMWFVMADELPTLDLDPDEQLAADLTAPEYRIDSHSRRVVERKDDTKRRLGRSPDRGDVCLLTLVRPPVVTIPDRGHGHGEDRESFDSGRPRNGSLTGDLLNDAM